MLYRDKYVKERKQMNNRNTQSGDSNQFKSGKSTETYKQLALDFRYFYLFFAFV